MKFLSVFFLLSAALLAASSPLSEDRDAQLWAEYKAKHGKNYSAEEDAARKTNFLNLHAEIERHNSNPHATYQRGHNALSDLHASEKQVLLGFLPGQASIRFTAETFKSDRAAPATMDLRTGSPCVGAVKNQGQCGSCWAFSAIASLEYQHCNASGNTYTSLSEEQLVDCTPVYKGCNGGLYTSAWQYLEGPGSESTAAYGKYTAGTTGVAGTCSASSSKAAAHVTSYGNVATSVSAITSALSTHGVISVAFYVQNDFFSYTKGVYHSSGCPTNNANHAVALVGYNHDSSSNMDYWIVRNSWGTSWGQSGYFWIQKGVNMCSIETYAAYVVGK